MEYQDLQIRIRRLEIQNRCFMGTLVAVGGLALFGFGSQVAPRPSTPGKPPIQPNVLPSMSGIVPEIKARRIVITDQMGNEKGVFENSGAITRMVIKSPDGEKIRIQHDEDNWNPGIAVMNRTNNWSVTVGSKDLTRKTFNNNVWVASYSKGTAGGGVFQRFIASGDFRTASMDFTEQSKTYANFTLNFSGESALFAIGDKSKPFPQATYIYKTP